MIRFSVILILFVYFSAYAQESDSASQPAEGYTICKNKSVVRTIRVEKDPADGKFITLYTKGGTDKEVGRAQWRPSAVRFQTNIKNNLTAAGWDCRDVKQFKILTSK